MTLGMKEPSPSDPSTTFADWVELRALEAADHNASLLDLVRDLNRATGFEAVDTDLTEDADGEDLPQPYETIDELGEKGERLAAAAQSELEARAVASDGAYPFTLDEHGVLTAPAQPARSLYVFMLLLTRFGGTWKPTPSIERGDRLFEDLASVAAAQFFGPRDLVSFQFGFPRRVEPAGFVDAIDKLCVALGEGDGNRRRPNTSDKKDAALDLVVARRFPDGRQGSLIGFGQCATGEDWSTKTTHLQPTKFCSSWMSTSPLVDPVQMFFIPHCVPEEKWWEISTQAGLSFDRCRMAAYTRSGLSPPLRSELQKWTSAVLKQKVRVAK
jgi:hypothetical protein